MSTRKARTGPAAPRLSRPAPPEGAVLSAADLTTVEADSRLEGLLFEADDAAGQDLGGVTFTGCELRRVGVHGADLTGATFAESSLREPNAPVLRAARSSWWNSTVAGARVGSAELYDSLWRSVRIEGGKWDYVNLRSAKLTDVLFDGCILGDLDLTGATGVRLAFKDCRIGTLTLHGARLTDVDLRGNPIGAVVNLEGLRGTAIDEYQLAELAPAFAAQLGITVA